LHISQLCWVEIMSVTKRQNSTYVNKEQRVKFLSILHFLINKLSDEIKR